MDIKQCDFKNNKCMAQRLNNSHNINGCCLYCKHQKNGKCDTKNLSCKLFYCPNIKNKYKVMKMKDIKLLNLLTIRQRILLKFDFFLSREELLNDLYSYSFIYTFIKSAFRRETNI